jgi:hypothetical protein
MKIGFIPDELFSICTQTVTQSHREKGFDNLAAKIGTGDNMAALTMIPEANAVLKVTNRYFTIRKWCFLGSIGVICFTFFIPWWSLFTVIVIFLADRVLAAREKDGWKFLSAVLLSLEMLSNDFSGWGKAYPQERLEALRVLNDNSESPKSAWLDYYLPQRFDLDSSQLKTFEPAGMAPLPK